MIKLAIVGLFVLSGACFLTSCGQKGPLYLPQTQTT